MISKILMATDGSKVEWKSVEYTVELAKQANAPIKLLYVIEENFVIAAPITDEACLQEAESFCKKHGILPQKAIRSGHPVEEVTMEAKKSKVDLIVLGYHGQNALELEFIGSVAFGTIHKDTSIPLLIVRR